MSTDEQHGHSRSPDDPAARVEALESLLEAWRVDPADVDVLMRRY